MKVLSKVFFYTFITTSLFAFYNTPTNPDLENHLFKIRDPKTPRVEFRRHIKKIGEHLAIAIANDLPKQQETIETVLQTSATHSLVKEPVVVITVLRAGLPMFEGFMQILSDAEGGFLIYQRDHETLRPVFHTQLLPSLEGKYVVLIDPMIATAGTVLDSLKLIHSKKPKKVFVAGVIAAKEGLEKIHQAYPETHLYSAAVDPILNDKGYIVPGLGDAGDRSYGQKA